MKTIAIGSAGGELIESFAVRRANNAPSPITIEVIEL